MRKAVWNVPLNGAVFFFDREAIHLLGARAQGPESHSLRRVVRDEMLDTVNNVCWRSAGPARQASDFLLLVRRACATGLACHCRQYFRWIPSEGNPADAPSRVYDRGKVGDKSTGLFHYQNFSVNTGQGLHNESGRSIVSSHQSCI